MKIGDKVRFLNDVGGGRVSGFQGTGIVLVEDEDGFEIPTSIHDVVVVNDDDFSSKRMVETQKQKEQPKAPATSIKQALSATAEADEEEETDPSDNFVAKPEERKGGDQLSVYLAFVPKDFRDMQGTRFMTYVVNDSNYYVHYTYLTASGTAWTLRADGEVAPNTKLRIDEFSREQLNERQHAAVQMLAFKREKPFLLKPAVEVQLRLDPVKFYKLNTFRENDFFETPALLQTIVENDQPARPLVVDAKQLKQKLYEPAQQESARKPSAADGRQPLVRRYEQSQSKSRPIAQKLKDDKIIVDLHANELLDTTAGMSASEILDYQLGVFKQTIEQYKEKKGQKLIFIHGKGEGVLRRALIHELNYRFKQHSYQDASFQEYGYGATQVTIR